MNYEKKMISLYARCSKHSHYQVLSEKLSEIIQPGKIKAKSRYEYERLIYIINNLCIEGMKILDIGGNTGFFTFELIEHGAKFVHYYEGNPTHSEFVRVAAEALNYDERINISNEYYSFEDNFNQKYDIVLMLNVLHHFGDDYGDRNISIERAKQQILMQLNQLASSTSFLVLQFGFNWKGDRTLRLFPNGTKEEMIQYIDNGIKNHWKIVKIGVAEYMNEQIIYSDLNNNNSKRSDTLGEFLNRPVFILKSLK